MKRLSIVFLFVMLSNFLALPHIARADVHVKALDGASLVQVKEQSGGFESFVTVNQKQVALSGQSNDATHRSYKINGSSYEIKASDEGFKLKSADGKLLWKIKYKEDKLKVSDNEENAHPYELKRKAADRIGVERDEKELGKVLFDAASKVVTVKTSNGDKLLQASAEKLSSFFALFLLDQIPAEERAILMTEFALRNL